jgi:predicted outer membrane lipoprotein
VSWLSVALLACAFAVLVAAEWPRLQARLGVQARARRERERRKASLRVLRSETDDFAASVQRDLAQLPTIEERDPRKR